MKKSASMQRVKPGDKKKHIFRGKEEIDNVSCVQNSLQIRELNRNYFSYFSTKTYVVGTQKNHLNEMVLLSTRNICLN